MDEVDVVFIAEGGIIEDVLYVIPLLLLLFLLLYFLFGFFNLFEVDGHQVICLLKFILDDCVSGFGGSAGYLLALDEFGG